MNFGFDIRQRVNFREAVATSGSVDAADAARADKPGNRGIIESRVRTVEQRRRAGLEFSAVSELNEEFAVVDVLGCTDGVAEDVDTGTGQMHADLAVYKRSGRCLHVDVKARTFCVRQGGKRLGRRQQAVERERRYVVQNKTARSCRSRGRVVDQKAMFVTGVRAAEDGNAVWRLNISDFHAVAVAGNRLRVGGAVSQHYRGFAGNAADVDTVIGCIDDGVARNLDNRRTADAIKVDTVIAGGDDRVVSDDNAALAERRVEMDAVFVDDAVDDVVKDEDIVHLGELHAVVANGVQVVVPDDNIANVNTSDAFIVAVCIVDGRDDVVLDIELRRTNVAAIKEHAVAVARELESVDGHVVAGDLEAEALAVRTAEAAVDQALRTAHTCIRVDAVVDAFQQEVVFIYENVFAIRARADMNRVQARTRIVNRVDGVLNAAALVLVDVDRAARVRADAVFINAGEDVLVVDDDIAAIRIDQRTGLQRHIAVARKVIARFDVDIAAFGGDRGIHAHIGVERRYNNVIAVRIKA